MKRLSLTFAWAVIAAVVAVTSLNWIGTASDVQAKTAESETILVAGQNQIPAAAQTDKARVWVAHFAPFGASTAVTVTVNGTDVLTNFEFGDTTNGYVALDPGPTQIQIRLPNGTPAISETVALSANTDYTVAAVGNGLGYAPLDLFIVDGGDDNTPPNSGESKVRIVHLAPFGTTITETQVDILDENDNPVNGLEDVPYGVSSGYFSLPAGSYNLKISAAGGAVTIPVPVTLVGGEIVTIYAIGDRVLIGNQDVQVLPIVYNSAEVYVAHLAPFADDMTASTAVTISVNGSPALTDFKFGDTSGGYVNLTLGSNTIEVLLPNGAVAMSATLNLTPTKYTVAAIGDAVNQPLELFPLFDEESDSSTAKLRIVHVAPFSNTLAGTEVDVRFDEDDSVVAGLTNVPYKGNSGYLALSAGTYDTKITAPGGGPAVIDVPALDLENGDIVTVFAIGDGTNQNLSILTIPPVATKIYLPIVLKNS